MPGARSTLVLLGTAGGTATYPAARRSGRPARHGIASAVVAGGRIHLVDAGQGVARQLTVADVSRRGPAHALEALRTVFLTHLHADHTMDLPNLLLCGYAQGWPDEPVDLYGPPAREGAGRGTADLLHRLIAAFGSDIADRTASGRRPRPESMVVAHDTWPADGASGEWTVYEDGDVRVRAALVDHGPMRPAFGYRVDTDDGSVVFSGDTRPCPALVRLARGADVLVHEAASPAFGRWLFGRAPRTDDQRRAVRAVLDKHTTVDQVGAIAAAAGVRMLVLSHLVPGSLPDERWLAGVTGYDGRIVVGQDLLRVGLADLRLAAPRPVARRLAGGR